MGGVVHCSGSWFLVVGSRWYLALWNGISVLGTTKCIVHKGLSTLHFKIITYYSKTIPSSFLKIPPSPHLTNKLASQVFLINRNETVKLSSLNTIPVKQKHNVGFFIFTFTLKYMLGNIWINKIHARQCLICNKIIF